MKKKSLKLKQSQALYGIWYFLGIQPGIQPIIAFLMLALLWKNAGKSLIGSAYNIPC